MVADIAHLLPEVRRLIDEGREREAYALANTQAREQLAKKGSIFPKGVVPHPAFDLRIQHKSGGEPSDYRRQVDLDGNGRYDQRKPHGRH